MQAGTRLQPLEDGGLEVSDQDLRRGEGSAKRDGGARAYAPDRV